MPLEKPLPPRLPRLSSKPRVSIDEQTKQGSSFSNKGKESAARGTRMYAVQQNLYDEVTCIPTFSGEV